MTIENVSQEICTRAKALCAEGVTIDTEGCLSARVGNLMVITPEGRRLSDLTPGDLSLVDLTTCAPAEGPKPDRRFALHAALYKKRKRVTTLLHAQSLSILTASRAGIEVPPLLDDMAQIVGVSARVATTWPYRGTAPVIRAMRGRNAVLLKNAGALCGAQSFDDAHAVAQVLEKGCKAFIESSFLGGGVKIPPLEAHLMRAVYLLKYAKQNGKNR